MQLFAEKGFRGATTRELAAAVGVSEPVLYQHFGAKSDLYSAIIETICAEGQKETDDALATYSESGDDERFFQTLGAAILKWYEERPEVVRLLLYSALEGHELRDRFVERQVSVLYQILNDYMERRIQQGAFRQVDAYLAARAFAGMFAHQGMATTIFGIKKLSGDHEAIARSLVELFLNGVRAKGAGGK